VRDGALALLAIVLAVPAANAWASSDGGSGPAAGTGGTPVVPEIAGIECLRGCGVHAGARRVAHAGTARSALRIRGTRLQSVQKVVFLGGSGSADDVFATPRRMARRALTVAVPAGARSGRIAVTTVDGWSSRPSLRAVRIHTHAPAPPALPAPAPGEAFIWPVRGSITGRFGEDRGSHYHAGLDIAAAGGTPIKAAAGGTVIHRGWMGGYGNYTCVAHVSLTTCYAHQLRYATTNGAQVSQGEVIGYVGSTGNSSGNHLHFEVRRGLSARGAPLDPLGFLPRG
jgi:murein DD-endopeptidase MepM/ murein hydrolase activator NlpD